MTTPDMESTQTNPATAGRVSRETLDACSEGYNQMARQRDNLAEALEHLADVVASTIPHCPMSSLARLEWARLEAAQSAARAALAKVQP
jgi:hypothetical protein